MDRKGSKTEKKTSETDLVHLLLKITLHRHHRLNVYNHWFDLQMSRWRETLKTCKI